MEEAKTFSPQLISLVISSCFALLSSLLSEIVLCFVLHPAKALLASSNMHERIPVRFSGGFGEIVSNSLSARRRASIQHPKHSAEVIIFFRAYTRLDNEAAEALLVS